LRRAHRGKIPAVLRRRLPLGAVIWIVVGVIVAANHNFFDNVDSLSGILSAVMAVLLWPLVLLDIHIAI
jgi:ABC-type anion transport system duplicated permease subunit